jgi:hypothetical protein
VWDPDFEMETSAFILKENIFLLTTTHGGLDCCVTSIRLMEEKKPAVLPDTQLQRCYYFLRRANGLMTIASGKPMERGSATFEEKMIIIFFSCMAGRSPLLSEMVMIPLPLTSLIPTSSQRNTISSWERCEKKDFLLLLKWIIFQGSDDPQASKSFNIARFSQEALGIEDLLSFEMKESETNKFWCYFLKLN